MNTEDLTESQVHGISDDIERRLQLRRKGRARVRQITLHQLVEQASKANIKAWIPFELTCDGEVIATVDDFSDVPQTVTAWNDVPQAAKDDVNKAEITTIMEASNAVRQTKPVFAQRKRKQVKADDTGLRFSKAAQAAGRMRRINPLANVVSDDATELYTG